MWRTPAVAILGLLLGPTLPSAHAAGKVTLESLLKQMIDLSLLGEYPDPPYVTKQFSSYDRASQTPKDHDSWFANGDFAFMLYDGVVAEKTPYFKSGPMQGRAPDGFFSAGTRVGIARNHKAIGGHIWAYTTSADGGLIGGKIPQGYIAKSAITMDPQGHVLADMDGPGSVVRIWSANPDRAGNIRIYLDGARKPVIDAPMQALLGGKWQLDQPEAPAGEGEKWTPFPDPIACERSRGYNLYFPIAYARHCKITIDKPDIYYHVDYRTYPRGTEVETFTWTALSRAREQLATVQDVLTGAVTGKFKKPWLTIPLKQARGLGKTVEPGQDLKVSFDGPGVIGQLQIRVSAILRQGETFNETEALRGLVLTGTFDGAAEPQIWCPLGDFFASSPGVNAYNSLLFKVGRVDSSRATPKEVEFRAFWPMPFEKSAVFVVRNLSKARAYVDLHGMNANRAWTDRSMHFHAKWRTETMKTRPFRDWTYCDLKGKGVFVGDMLSVLNPVAVWWGEGDEKIYVDGEKFPSWFGTGTEDYYAYAWGDPRPFQHAYHNQTRCDGRGWTSLNRFHILDAIPFEKSFRFDMEVWHWTPNIDVTYAATSYWYARPGATDDFRPVEARVLQNIPAPPPPFRIKGAIEGERLKILGQSSKFDLDPQDMGPFTTDKQQWSGDRHLWGRPGKAGEWADLELPVAADGKYQIVVHLTKARDYGIVQLSLNGQALGKPVDCYHFPEVVATGAIDLGAVDLKKGTATLRVEAVGTNPKSVGVRYMWGLDCILLRPAKE